MRKVKDTSSVFKWQLNVCLNLIWHNWAQKSFVFTQWKLLFVPICTHHSHRQPPSLTVTLIQVFFCELILYGTHLQIKPFAWIKMMCVCVVGGVLVFADHESDSSSCKQVKSRHADWSRTARTHAHTHKITHAHPMRYTPGPLERALVTPHKSI